jgi:hypothetical protein
MSNLSYCRFRNTLDDLRDCEDKLDEIGGDLSELSKEEAQAAKSLIAICRDIANNFGGGNEQ